MASRTRQPSILVAQASESSRWESPGTAADRKRTMSISKRSGGRKMSLSKRSGSVLGRSGSVLHRSGSLLHHRRPSRLGSRVGAGMGRRVSIIRKNAMALFPNREETSSSEEDETDSELENGEKNVELTAKLVRDAKVKSYREELELLKDRHAALQGTVAEDQEVDGCLVDRDPV